MTLGHIVPDLLYMLLHAVKLQQSVLNTQAVLFLDFAQGVGGRGQVPKFMGDQLIIRMLMWRKAYYMVRNFSKTE